MKMSNRNFLGNIMRLVVIGLCLMATVLVHAQSSQKRILPSVLTLYQGESTVLEAPGVERLSVGKTNMLSTTLLKNGEVVLIAESAGETNMQVWFSDGRRENMSIVIVASNSRRE